MSKPPVLPAKKSANPPKPQEDLKEEIEKAVGSLIPQGQRAQVVARVQRVVVQRQEMFSGPIAHPEHLEQYEDICPGAADRIISMAEREQNASIELARSAVENERKYGQMGQIFGFASFLSLVIGSILVAWLGQPVLAGTFVGVGALGTIGVFINGRWQNNGKS